MHSGAEHFRIDHYVRPSAVDPAGPSGRRRAPARTPSRPCSSSRSITTRSPPATAVREISAALNRIEPATLLFLRNITRLRAHGAGVTDLVIERRTQPRPVRPAAPALAARHVTLTRDEGPGQHRPGPPHRGLARLGPAAG